MMTTLSARSSRRRAARAFAVLAVLVLAVVPSLARMGQKLETASHAPSFRSIDCPPKKVTVAPAATAVATPVALKTFERAPVARFAVPSDAPLPRSPHFAAPRPLRAPPAHNLV